MGIQFLQTRDQNVIRFWFFSYTKSEFVIGTLAHLVRTAVLTSIDLLLIFIVPPTLDGKWYFIVPAAVSAVLLTMFTLQVQIDFLSRTIPTQMVIDLDKKIVTRIKGIFHRQQAEFLSLEKLQTKLVFAHHNLKAIVQIVVSQKGGDQNWELCETVENNAKTALRKLEVATLQSLPKFVSREMAYENARVDAF